MNQKQLIDQYGKLDEEIKELEKKKKVIKKKLDKLEVGIHMGEKYAVIIAEVERVEYDVRKVAKRLKRDTLKVVSVVAKELKKYIPEIELPQYVKKTSSYKKISVKRKEDLK